MLFTEKEAERKRCTVAIPIMLLDRERRDALAAGGMEVGTTCIGSKCAQWCWYDYANKEGKTYFPKGEAPERANFHKGKAFPSPDQEKNPSEERVARGYCGFTGSKGE